MQFCSGNSCGHSGIRRNSAGTEITILAGSTAKIPFRGIPGIDRIPPDSGRNTRRTVKNSIPLSSDDAPPTSLWKGEGQVSLRSCFWAARMLVVEPTSLNRGEGLMAGLFGVVEGPGQWGRGGVLRGKGGGGWMRANEQRSTVMQLMWASNSDRPPKIMFDMNARQVDNKIKNCIILEVPYRL